MLTRKEPSNRAVCSVSARSGSQVIVPYRCLEDEQRHLKLMGDLGQVRPLSIVQCLIDVE